MRHCPGQACVAIYTYPQITLRDKRHSEYQFTNIFSPSHVQQNALWLVGNQDMSEGMKKLSEKEYINYWVLLIINLNNTFCY